MNRLKKFLIFTFFLSTFLFFSIISYVNAISEDLASNVLRLHVIANSDSAEDQALKLEVRDKLLEYMNGLCINTTTKEEAITQTKTHLNDFKELARNVIIDRGYDYDVNVELGSFNFPTKTYGDISFPAGIYDALKVKIGNSSGHNWWCVMFPPLCFVDITSAEIPEESEDTLKENLSDEEFSIISRSDSTSEFKFKIIEIFNNFKLANAKK